MLEIKNLSFAVEEDGRQKEILRNLNLTIDDGKFVVITGPNGSGKSTLARLIMGIEKPTAGSILFDGRDVTDVKGNDLKKLRGDMQIVFQDPYSSLNPRMSVHDTIAEPLRLSGKYKGPELENECRRLMDLVGIESRLYNAYPHEMDGGRRQRVGIGRALAMHPRFIVCDEPVSALDVSIQAQVLNLLMDLQDNLGLTYMFVTHDLSVVKHISHSICVMYLGQLVETCATDELFSNQLHPYSKALLSAIPSTDIHHPQKRIVIKGEITSPIDPKPGCRFATRCPYATEACSRPQRLDEVLPGHFVSCCRCREINKL